MSGSAWSVALVGLQGRLVEVEAATGGGLPRTVIVGLPDAALYDARDRCKAAVASSGLQWPQQALTINLTPATLPKAGSHYDLAIAAATLEAAGVIPRNACQGIVMMGELGLDGRVRPARGILPGLLAASDKGIKRAIVPASQRGEASLVADISVRTVTTLTDLVNLLCGRPVPEHAEPEADAADATTPSGDLADVVGQTTARWALEVAAAGRHHLFLQGPPGVGKTMLAERLPGLLPDLTQLESIEVSALHSLAGASLSSGLIIRPPYADPHPNASLSSVVGGGQRVAKPGAISLAHRGVLFMDEAPEFSPKVLEAMRGPLESGRVTIGRCDVLTTFPSRFQLVLAANPCPCGNHDNALAVCTCTPAAVRRYSQRISGPILDRVDLRVQLKPVRLTYAADLTPSESTADVACRVLEARQRQHRRLTPLGLSTNGEIPGPALRHALPIPEGIELVEEKLVRGQLSARGVDKCLRLAWTLADLAGSERPTRAHVHAAMVLRCGETVSAA